MGTGIMTLPLYKELPKAEIVCMDYAAEMMEPAKERAALAGIENIHFQQGDVGALPFPEESLRKRLMESYTEVSVERVETVACFHCVKK